MKNNRLLMMRSLIPLMAIATLCACGKHSAPIWEKPTVTNAPPPISAPNNRPRSPKELDEAIAYFYEKHPIRLLKPFEFGWSTSRFRGIAFKNGKKLEGNGIGGSGCFLVQPKDHTSLGVYKPQSLIKVVPLDRDKLERELRDDMRYFGVEFEFSFGGRGILYCVRHETLGPVTLQDFKDHFFEYIELGN